jgi:hypothetical protein
MMEANPYKRAGLFGGLGGMVAGGRLSNRAAPDREVT